MNLHRKMCLYLIGIFVLTILIYVCTKHNHPTLTNIIIAIITGTFLSIYTSLVNYLHEREEFFNNLFFSGIFINSNYEQIKQLIINIDETSNLKYVIDTMKNFSNSINSILMTINFAKYSPFRKKSTEAKLVEQVYNLYSKTTQAVILVTKQIEISNIEANIILLELNSLKNPCSCCASASQQIQSHTECVKYADFQNNLKILQDKLTITNNATKELIKNLYQNVENLQSEYLEVMNCLHCKTKNKTKWNEINKFNKNNISINMKNYVKDTINGK